jgi:hypothetical protein
VVSLGIQVGVRPERDVRVGVAELVDAGAVRVVVRPAWPFSAVRFAGALSLVLLDAGEAFLEQRVRFAELTDGLLMARQ